jgi:hypothetical protein
VEEDGNGGGIHSREQKQIHTPNIMGSGVIQEPQIVQEKPNIVFGPHVEDLSEPGEVPIEVIIISRLVLRVIKRVTDTRLGRQKPEDIREEDEEIFDGVEALKERVDVRVVVKPLEAEQPHEEQVLHNERIAQCRLVRVVPWVHLRLGQKSEGVDGSDGLQNSGEGKGDDQPRIKEGVLVIPTEEEDDDEILDEIAQPNNSVNPKFPLEEQIFEAHQETPHSLH